MDKDLKSSGMSYKPVKLKEVQLFIRLAKITI
jgi:hypothetical protein